jgi:hypothetical protein
VNAAQLLSDLIRLGIRIEAHGDRLRYSPRSAVTPDLADRMKAHKGELLAILRRDPDTPAIDPTDATQVWQAALDRLEGDPVFPPDVMEGLRAADARWADDPEAGETDEAIEVIDPLDPCPECGTLELWQTLAGNWRCLQCDPPTMARRLRERAARLKTDRTDWLRINARGDP